MVLGVSQKIPLTVFEYMTTLFYVPEYINLCCILYLRLLNILPFDNLCCI